MIILHIKKLADNGDGCFQNSTISLDRDFFQTFCDTVGGDQPARQLIRSWIIKHGDSAPGKSLSRQVQSMILQHLFDLLMLRKQAEEISPQARPRKMQHRPIADLAEAIQVDGTQNPERKFEVIWDNKIRLRKLFIEAALRAKELVEYGRNMKPPKKSNLRRYRVDHWEIRSCLNSVYDELQQHQWHTPATITAAFLLDPANASVALRGSIDKRIERNVKIMIKLKGSPFEYGELPAAMKDEITRLPNVS